MKKAHIPIPEPSSKFQKIKCSECEEEQIVYSHTTTVIKCNSCGNPIAQPTGSKAKLFGKISETIE